MAISLAGIMGTPKPRTGPTQVELDYERLYGSPDETPAKPVSDFNATANRIGLTSALQQAPFGHPPAAGSLPQLARPTGPVVDVPGAARQQQMNALFAQQAQGISSRAAATQAEIARQRDFGVGQTAQIAPMAAGIYDPILANIANAQTSAGEAAKATFGADVTPGLERESSSLTTAARLGQAGFQQQQPLLSAGLGELAARQSFAANLAAQGQLADLAAQRQQFAFDQADPGAVSERERFDYQKEQDRLAREAAVQEEEAEPTLASAVKQAYPKPGRGDVATAGRGMALDARPGERAKILQGEPKKTYDKIRAEIRKGTDPQEAIAALKGDQRTHSRAVSLALYDSLGDAAVLAELGG